MNNGNKACCGSLLRERPDLIGKRKIARGRRGIAMLVVMIMAGVVGVLSVTMLRVSRNDQMWTTVEQQRRVARCAAQGAAHRGVAMLRRDPTLRGPVAVTGPEIGIGVVSSVSIATNATGQLTVFSTAQYQGTIVREQIVVDPSRL
ncbi:hypothetical protein SH139x_003499 [Planctomycetaceae bacterium SH139]